MKFAIDKERLDNKIETLNLKNPGEGCRLKEILSYYEGSLRVSIISNENGDICHGIEYKGIYHQEWYPFYADKYVISFKIINDKKCDNEMVLLLCM